MKYIYIVRHAEAMKRSFSVPDFKRTLTKTGKKDARKTALRVKKSGVVPDLLISSPASRAIETAIIFAEEFSYSVKKIALREILFNEPGIADMLQIIKEIPETHNSVMLFGHNPYFMDFASRLAPDFKEDIPKCGVVGIGFDISSWSEIENAAGGTVVVFDYPGRKKIENKKMRDEIARVIADKVIEYLNTVDEDSAQKMMKPLQSHSAQIALKFTNHMKRRLKAQKRQEQV